MSCAGRKFALHVHPQAPPCTSVRGGSTDSSFQKSVARDQGRSCRSVIINSGSTTLHGAGIIPGTRRTAGEQATLPHRGAVDRRVDSIAFGRIARTHGGARQPRGSVGRPHRKLALVSGAASGRAQAWECLHFDAPLGCWNDPDKKSRRRQLERRPASPGLKTYHVPGHRPVQDRVYLSAMCAGTQRLRNLAARQWCV